MGHESDGISVLIGGIVLELAARTARWATAEDSVEGTMLTELLNLGFGPGHLPLGYHPDRLLAQAEYAIQSLGGQLLGDSRDPDVVGRALPGEIQ